jgi:hypothetical protein
MARGYELLARGIHLEAKLRERKWRWGMRACHPNLLETVSCIEGEDEPR